MNVKKVIITKVSLIQERAYVEYVDLSGRKCMNSFHPNSLIKEDYIEEAKKFISILVNVPENRIEFIENGKQEQLF